MPSIAIIGATGTIGSTLCRRLVKQGRSLLLLGRDPEKLRRLSLELHQPFSVVNLRDSQNLEDVLVQAASQVDGFDGLVNCVGSLLLKPAHSTSDDEFREVLETNLFSAFATVRAGVYSLSST